MKPIFSGEHVGRMTLDQDIMNSPEDLYNFMAAFSVKEWRRANHYNDFKVCSVIPAFDANEDGSFSGSHPKLLSATNYRPDPASERRKNLADIRVCAEQALIDEAAHDGDTLVGVMFSRGPEEHKPIEGCRPEMKSLHLCRECRGRLLSRTSPDLLVVTFAGVSLEPIEALTLRQMIEFHDFHGEYPAQVDGQSPREVAISALASLKHFIPFRKSGFQMPMRVLPVGRRSQ